MVFPFGSPSLDRFLLALNEQLLVVLGVLLNFVGRTDISKKLELHNLLYDVFEVLIVAGVFVLGGFQVGEVEETIFDVV